MRACGKNATTAIESATGTLSNDVAMPLALILNELLTNAAKYAAADTGNAVVHARK
jgi:two-component sensor histidine kinase